MAVVNWHVHLDCVRALSAGILAGDCGGDIWALAGARVLAIQHGAAIKKV